MQPTKVPHHSHLRPAKVLVVESDAPEFDIVSEATLRLGWPALHAWTAKTSLRHLKEERSIRLVVLDHNRSRLDLFVTFLSALQADDELCRIPVVLLSHARASELPTDLASLPITRHIVKPVGTTELARHLEQVALPWGG